MTASMAASMTALCCRFCGLEFQLEHYDFIAEHESNCRNNPQNHCRYCGMAAAGWGWAGAAKEARRSHEKICRHNPKTVSRCLWCGLGFKSMYDGRTADELRQLHEENCKASPYNACSGCGLKFGNRVHLTHHEAYTCPALLRHTMRDELPRFKYRKPRTIYDAFRDSYGPEAVQPDPIMSPALEEINNIARKLAVCSTAEERKAVLKNQLLKWHPDKQLRGEFPPECVRQVFLYVNNQWRCEQRR